MFAKLQNGMVIAVAEAESYNDFLKANGFVPFDDLTEAQKQMAERLGEHNE